MALSARCAVLLASLSLLASSCAARRQPPRSVPVVVDAAVADAAVDAVVDAAPPEAALPLMIPAGARPGALEPGALASWRDALARDLSAAGASGWTSAVIVGEAVVDRHATGRTAGVPSQPLTTDKARPLGRVTRVVTALLIAALIEEGHLDWSAPATRLRRDWSAAGVAPTVAEMACGCFGIAAVPGTPPRTAQQVLDRLEAHLAAGDTLEAMPTPVLSAAAGYLAALGAPSAPIEPGAAYADQVAERVVEPLGLSLTIGGPDAPGIVPVFAPDDGAWASLDDLSRLAVALLEGGLTHRGGRVVERGAIEMLVEPFDGQAGMASRAALAIEQRGSLAVRVAGGGTRGGVTRMILADGLGWVVRVEGTGPGIEAALEAGLEGLLARRYRMGDYAEPQRQPAPAQPKATPPTDAGRRDGGTPPDAGP